MAFVSRWIASWARDADNHKKNLRSLKTELTECRKSLIGKGYLLNDSFWKSTLASGDIKLLTYDQRTKIGTVYVQVDNYNYEAKRTRDASARAASTKSQADIDYHGILTRQSKNMEQDLDERIERLLREKWWPEK